MPDLLTRTDHGLSCQTGGFYIDPWRPVHRAVITHAHADHARPGSSRYLCAAGGEAVLRQRVQHGAVIDTADWGQVIDHNGVRISLHPAGHVLGSAQVRVEHRGEVWVVTGDYKTQPDVTCDAFEPVRCDVLITECTFGLPIYRWPAPEDEIASLQQWRRDNQASGRTSVLLAYALGKAQRILAMLGDDPGSIIVHGSVHRFVEVYREAGVTLPPVLRVSDDGVDVKALRGQALVVAPASVVGSPWLRRFGAVSLASASGWMQVRGRRRRSNLDRGFVISDHVDWPSLMTTIEASGAQRIGLTHGYTHEVCLYLREQGKDAWEIDTRFGEEQADEPREDAEPMDGQMDLTARSDQGADRA